MFSPNHVSVTVVSARNLTGKGKNGKNDAFVVIQLGDKKFQTSIQKKAVTPYWEEECEFFYENKYSELILTVYHRNLLGFDEFLGQIRLPLDEVCEQPKSLNPNQRPPNRWFPLKGKSGKNDEHKYRGELEIRLLFSRKQQPVVENQQPPRSKSPSVSSFTMGRQDSMESHKSKGKTMTLPLGGLKKKEFMGSMPSLFGNQKLSRPPSPTGSIASISKKKSIFSKLKPSGSFHTQPRPASEWGSVADSSSARNSMSLSGGAPSPTLHESAAITGGRRSALEPLNERQSQGFDDEEQSAGAGHEITNNQVGISPEPDDPQPVIRIKKRGGGVFTIGGGQKSRPASAFLPSEHATSVLPNRFDAITGPHTGSNVAQLASSGPVTTQIAPVSSLPKDGSANAAMPKEDLVAVINDQRSVINRQRVRIRELEDYIDQLLVRVITTQPELLQSASTDDYCKKRAPGMPAPKRNSFSFGFGK